MRAYTAHIGALALAMIVAGALGSCALLDSATKRAGELVADACAHDTDARELVLARVNEHAAPHRIAVTCAPN